MGTGEDLTIKELAETIQKITGHQGDVVWEAEKPYSTPRQLIDVCKMQALGWKHQVQLEKEIQKTYTWFLETIENYKEVKL